MILQEYHITWWPWWSRSSRGTHHSRGTYSRNSWSPFGTLQSRRSWVTWMGKKLWMNYMGTTACFTAYATYLYNKLQQQKTTCSRPSRIFIIHQVLTENLTGALGTQNKQTLSLPQSRFIYKKLPLLPWRPGGPIAPCSPGMPGPPMLPFSPGVPGMPGRPGNPLGPGRPIPGSPWKSPKHREARWPAKPIILSSQEKRLSADCQLILQCIY